MKDLKHLKSLSTLIMATFALMALVVMKPVHAAEQTAPSPTNPLVLKVSIWTPGNISYTKACGWMLEEVERLAKGRLKFEYYYSGALLPARETLSGLKAGVADVAFVPTNYTPGKTPLCTVTSLPMTGQRFYSSALAFADVNKLPELKKELAAFKTRYLGFVLGSSYHIFANKPIRSIADIKGMKIRAVGAQSVLLKALGAVPVSIVSTEVYTALERGTIDGALANPVFAWNYKYVEVAKHMYQIYLGTLGMLLGINQDSWNKIPSDIQKMFEDPCLLEQAAIRGHIIYEVKGESNIRDAVAKGELTVTQPSAEDVKFVTKVAKETVWKDWIEKMEKKGLPGQKVLDVYLESLKKWEARSPFK